MRQIYVDNQFIQGGDDFFPEEVESTYCKYFWKKRPEVRSLIALPFRVQHALKLTNDKYDVVS